MLNEIFTELVSTYTSNEEQCTLLWNEVAENYSGSKRYYHNLSHIENMYKELIECKAFIEDWNTLLFALFYHDIIYKATRKDNEEQSTIVAVKRLKAINYSSAKSALCSQHILATKTHIASKSADTNFFTDADLSILGVDNETYSVYVKQIRKEYAIYPDFMYKPGRKKVLQHFLEMDRIYKTEHFFNLYEHKAKENMSIELLSL